MTHEEAKELLPRYAAGILSDATSDSVRAHLAAGCRDCLEDLFRRPFGLPARVGAPEPEPVVLEPPPPPAPSRQPIGFVLAASLAVIAVASSVMLARAPRPEAPPHAAEVSRTLAELQELRAALATRLSGLERAAASAATASRDAEETRSAMADMERELEAARLRIGALKRAMRRQDVDFDQKRRSMEAMIARLSGQMPAGGAGAGPARQTQTLVPCEPTHLDLWSFPARQGRRYTITAETVDAASAADLCLVGSCDGTGAFAADDELPCRSAPGFGCPRATVAASTDGACVVAVTVCSPGCGEGRAARYEISVEGADSLALLADDVSAVTGETADVF